MTKQEFNTLPKDVRDKMLEDYTSCLKYGLSDDGPEDFTFDQYIECCDFEDYK